MAKTNPNLNYDDWDQRYGSDASILYQLLLLLKTLLRVKQAQPAVPVSLTRQN